MAPLPKPAVWGFPLWPYLASILPKPHFYWMDSRTYNEHYLLAPGEFTESDWDFLHQPLTPPRSTTALATDGNQAIAQAVADFFAT